MTLDDRGKMWGKNPFWGLEYNLDPMWNFDDEQREIQRQLIQLCRTTLRPNAIKSDQTYEFPRANMDALASLGLLSLIVPIELGGRGQSHVCASMVAETIARYGCPSTALVYVMHTGACAAALLRHHDNTIIQDVMRRLDKDKLIGTLVYSDPATGGHFWYTLSSRARPLADGAFQVLRYGSWATSGGFADWYILQTISPDFKSDFSRMTNFLCFKDEVRRFSDEWSALGMHGNQSGAVICEGIFPAGRQVGPHGDGYHSNDECVDPFFLLLTSAAWCGISMGAIDLAKKHSSQKRHADLGLRVCDYPTIKDYFGECVSETNGRRMMVYNVAQGLDKQTNSMDWSIHKDIKAKPRFQLLHWLWQLKYECARNVYKVTDDMLKVCGGTGYKTELGLERLLRDGKAGWVMAPTNEILRQWVGMTAFGIEPDYWAQHSNHRVIRSETNKLTTEEKEELVERLQKEVKMAKSDYKGENDYQDSDFDNPFNTAPPRAVGAITVDNVAHNPALKADEFSEVTLKSVGSLADQVTLFSFAFENEADHSGCMPGQFVQIRVQLDGDGKRSVRYLSPVSPTNQYGTIDIVMKFESIGEFSQHFKALKPGMKVEMRGPCGGFEYSPNVVEHISLISSGVGATPVIQILRSIMADKDDKTSISFINYSETEADILFREEIDAIQKQDGRLNVFYTIGDADDKWEGGEGYIEDYMLEKNLPKPGTKRQKVLVCGGPNMVVSTLEHLRQLGYASEDVFVYGHFGVEQIRAIYGQRTKLSTHYLA